MYLIKTPKFIQNLFPNFTWRTATQEKVLYLTFDDGPIAQITPWVLKQLAAYQAKATFFCVGQNIKEHPEVFQQLIDEGHSVGNHTMNHSNGWLTDNLPYFHNVRHCANLVKSTLFRPPYGKLRPRQAQFLQRHYRIVMWDVLSGDFDPNVSKEQVVKNVTNNATEGSIVVLHDSYKTEEKLRYALPRILDHFAKLGYRFEALNDKALEINEPILKTA